MKLILILAFSLISIKLNHSHRPRDFYYPPVRGGKNKGSAYPVEGLAIALFISLAAHYRIRRTRELLSQEKLGLALNMVNRTRTPLTLIQNLLEDVHSDELSQDTSRKIKSALDYARHVVDSHQNIVALNQVWKKMHSELKINELELYAYVDSIVTHSRLYAMTRRIQLKVNKESGYVSCHVDEIMMATALQCLFSKIIDFTSSEESINVTVSHTENDWCLRITNHSNLKERNAGLKKMFIFRMPIHFCRSYCIARKIIRLHGGKMVGMKCNGMVDLQISVPLDQPCRERGCPVIRSSTFSGCRSSIRYGEHSVTDTTFAVKAPHVLLVMEDKELSDFLKKTLSRGFQVSVFEDPEQIYAFLGQRNPDVIVIDEAVNGIYGTELCLKIKSNSCMCNIPVILLIGSNDNENYLAHIGCGADRIELRMVNVCRLKTDIMALISRRDRQRERLKEIAAGTLPVDHSEKISQGDSDAILIDKIQKCLEKNLSMEKYTVDMLCADIGMSRTAFYNRIKYIAGQSPTSYILSYKMGIAKTMLASGQYSVSDIAAFLGYCDAKYFGKKFKEFHGISPMRYVRDAMG